MAVYQGLSRQGRAVRGGISSRASVYHSTPVAPRRTAQYEDDVVDLAPDQGGVFRSAHETDGGVNLPGGYSYAPKTPASARLDDLLAPDLVGMIGGRAGNAAVNMGVAKYAGVPSSQLPGVGLSSLAPTLPGTVAMIGGHVMDAVAKDKTRKGYRGLTDPIGPSLPGQYSAVDLSRFNMTRDFAKPEDVMAYEDNVSTPMDYTPSERARHRLANMEDEEFMERTRGVLSQTGSAVGVDDKKTFIDPVTQPSPELVRQATKDSSGGDPQAWADEWAKDLSPETQDFMRSIGVLGNRQFTELPADFYSDMRGRDNDRGASNGFGDRQSSGGYGGMGGI